MKCVEGQRQSFESSQTLQGSLTIAIETRRPRTWLRPADIKDVEMLDNRLDYLDQASYLCARATGREQCIQGIWIYDRPIELEGLRRFHDNLGYGLVGRRIERSPLPFGRHRWVSSPGPASPLDFCEPRPRSELSDWIDERSQMTVDPEFGPGWHVGVLPMTDGSTAVSLVISHSLADGTGGVLTVVEAALGVRRVIDYPQPQSRPRLRGMVADARDTVRDTPQIGRALAGAAGLAARTVREWSPEKVSAPKKFVDTGEVVVLPAIDVVVDIDAWDACAAERHGNSYSLLAALSARLGARMGRVRADTGEVTLMVALSDRTLKDTRAHAMSFVNVRIDPTQVTVDQMAARTTIRGALKKLRDRGEQASHDDAFGLLALTPFTPKRAVRGAASLAFGFDDQTVTCSNMGDLFPEYARIDGTDADYVLARGVDQGVKRVDIERAGGQLVLVAARAVGRVSIGIVAYQCGAENTPGWLRTLTADSLDEFGLKAQII
ncbi:MAG: hypothetical protein WCE30_28870 [Mycobacterium sp.]